MLGLSVRHSSVGWYPGLSLRRSRFRDRAREAILNFKNDLPFQYEEHRDIPEAREYLTKQALEYAELADPENYQAYRTEEDSDQIAIVHVSPSAAEPENVARAEEANYVPQADRPLDLGVQIIRREDTERHLYDRGCHRIVQGS